MEKVEERRGATALSCSATHISRCVVANHKIVHDRLTSEKHNEYH